jgi:ABC-2 type transport system permease protein
MANELTPTSRWTASQTRAQYAAIARLRWRITVNQFRKKGGGGEMAGRIIIGLFFCVFAGGAMFFAASMSYLAAGNGRLNRFDLVLWGIFVFCQFVNIQIGQPGTVFDPTQLIRFPMRASNYIVIRLFFGLLSPGNVVGALLSFAAAVGITIAIPSLWLYALISLSIFAITNALFSRMIFAWVDRWLSTRRAREVFTALIFIVSIGFQYLNFMFNPAYGHGSQHHVSSQRVSGALFFYHRAQPYIHPLPPGLIASSLVAASHGNIMAFVEFSAACALFAAAFFAIFAWRIGVEFRGENLTDAANAVSTKPKTTPAQRHELTTASTTTTKRTLLPNAVAAVIGKEFMQIRRNTGVFYGLIAPIVLVFIFAGRWASHSNASWVFPAALVYTMFGIAPLSYNAFGLEGAGVQFYFMAPTPLRDVFLAKNIVNFALAAIEIAVVAIVISYIATPPTITMLLSAILWCAATLLLTTAIGNRRSVTAPKKIDLGRTASKQASPVSSLISFGILLGSGGLGAGCLLLALYFNQLWTLVPFFAALAAGAFFLYLQGLRSIDSFALANRDQLFEVLCKQ